jgi:hypothetical protein
VQYVASEAAFVPADAVEVEAVRTEWKREIRFEPDMGPSLEASHVGAPPPPDPTFSVPPVPTAADHQISDPSNTSPALKPSPPGVFTPSRRASSYAGTWNARIGSSFCKVQLSTVPSLDLYKASAQGCSHDSMRNVNGWSFRENQIVLFSRGQLTARLSGAEASLSGTLNGSSEAIEMSR